MASEKGLVHYIRNFTGLDFTVDNTLEDVGFSLTGNPSLVQDFAAGYFRAKDNVLIESIVFQLPFQFGQGDITSVMTAELQWNDPTVPATGDILEFGEGGKLFVPDVAVEYNVNAFVVFPAGAVNKFRIQLKNISGRISMVNCPDLLNGNTYDAAVYLKVRHTLNMTP